MGYLAALIAALLAILAAFSMLAHFAIGSWWAGAIVGAVVDGVILYVLVSNFTVG